MGNDAGKFALTPEELATREVQRMDWEMKKKITKRSSL